MTTQNGAGSAIGFLVVRAASPDSAACYWTGARGGFSADPASALAMTLDHATRVAVWHGGEVVANYVPDDDGGPSVVRCFSEGVALYMVGPHDWTTDPTRAARWVDHDDAVRVASHIGLATAQYLSDMIGDDSARTADDDDDSWRESDDDGDDLGRCDSCDAHLSTCCDGIVRCLECAPCPACDSGPGPDADDDDDSIDFSDQINRIMADDRTAFGDPIESD